MNTLVVGGAGYIGGALTDILGNNVRVYDKLVFEERYFKDVDFVYGDITDYKRLQPHLDWADCVVWLAAIVGDGACALDPGYSKVVNQDTVKYLADNFDGRIVFMSTCSVYGAQDGLLNEESPTNPLSIYAATKLAAEEYLSGKNSIIFRLGTIFGVGDRFSRIRTDLVVNTMTARAVKEGKLKVFGGEQYRPLLHVKDAAQAIADNIATAHTGIYNLHFENKKMIDLAKEVVNIVPAQIEIVDTTFEDSRNYKVDSSKARAIGFKPQFDVSDGVEQIKFLLETGRIKDINDPRYSNVAFLGVTNVKG